MSTENFLPSMYGGSLYSQSTKATTSPSPSTPVSKEKMASRVIGGLKAQNSHMKAIEIDGEIHQFPRAEYVSQLETQIKEARNKIRDLETKQARLIKANNRIMEKLRQIETELSNKVDLR